jgi:hypothetical protein
MSTAPSLARPPLEWVTPLGFPTSMVSIEIASDLEEPVKEPEYFWPKGMLIAEGTKVLVDLFIIFGVDGLD